MASDDPFEDIFREFERMVEELFGGGWEPHDGGRPVGGGDARVDVQAFDDRVEVVADLPGTSADDVDLRCDGEVLRIRAGRYDERVELPAAVDETSASASFNNGVLSVTFEAAGDGGVTIDVP